MVFDNSNEMPSLASTTSSVGETHPSAGADPMDEKKHLNIKVAGTVYIYCYFL